MADREASQQMLHSTNTRSLWLCSTYAALCVKPQYSQKEDKYEEEIKVLSDKLKEVSSSCILLIL